jgi:hypothetical protein
MHITFQQSISTLIGNCVPNFHILIDNRVFLPELDDDLNGRIFLF